MAIAILLWATSARADATSANPDETVTPRIRLRHDLWLDGGLTLGLAAGSVAWVIARPTVLTTSCGLCDGAPGRVDAVDDFFRRGLKRADIAPAALFGDIFGYGLAPMSAIGLTAVAASIDRRSDEVAVDLLLIVEATVVDLAVDQAVLGVVRRERPYYHFADEQRRAGIATANDVSSFPSGHVSAAFAMGASAYTVASMRGYRLAPMIGIMGALIGVTTGYLRMAADRHYFTDVVAGAAIGTLTGAGVPLLFHGPEKAEQTGFMHSARISTEGVPGGRTVSVGWLF